MALILMKNGSLSNNVIQEAFYLGSLVGRNVGSHRSSIEMEIPPIVSVS
jgi:hypothetical protein